MSQAPAINPASASKDETTSAVFASLVMQQTNMALMLMGHVPHPESGETVRELDGARIFIDQLEMIEAKTRGNLNPDEEKLLKQCLTTVRMAFVDAVNRGEAPATPTPPPASGLEPAANPAPSGPTESQADSSGETDETRKKFTKKY